MRVIMRVIMNLIINFDNGESSDYFLKDMMFFNNNIIKALYMAMH